MERDIHVLVAPPIASHIDDEGGVQSGLVVAEMKRKRMILRGGCGDDNSI